MGVEGSTLRLLERGSVLEFSVSNRVVAVTLVDATCFKPKRCACVCRLFCNTCKSFGKNAGEFKLGMAFINFLLYIKVYTPDYYKFVESATSPISDANLRASVLIFSTYCLRVSVNSSIFRFKEEVSLFCSSSSPVRD